jgi:hypothetical protein
MSANRQGRQSSRQRGKEGFLRFEYVDRAGRTKSTEDPVAELLRVVRDQGERIARLEAKWLITFGRRASTGARPT